MAPVRGTRLPTAPSLFVLCSISHLEQIRSDLANLGRPRISALGALRAGGLGPSYCRGRGVPEPGTEPKRKQHWLSHSDSTPVLRVLVFPSWTDFRTPLARAPW